MRPWTYIEYKKIKNELVILEIQTIHERENNIRIQKL
jgi:hypothetical protein